MRGPGAGRGSAEAWQDRRDELAGEAEGIAFAALSRFGERIEAGEEVERDEVAGWVAAQVDRLCLDDEEEQGVLEAVWDELGGVFGGES